MILKNNSDLIIASNNKNKIREIREIFVDVFTNIYSLFDKNIDIEIEEIGITFEENAIIKAETISKLTGMYALADDSGLEVYALGGGPGVYSARYAGEPCSDYLNNQLLLKNMQNINDRRARFTSSVVICAPDGKIISSDGHVEGEIKHELIGSEGFGYDPLFYSFELSETFGTASNKMKNEVSHRARALHDLAKKITMDND